MLPTLHVAVLLMLAAISASSQISGSSSIMEILNSTVCSSSSCSVSWLICPPARTSTAFVPHPCRPFLMQSPQNGALSQIGDCRKSAYLYCALIEETNNLMKEKPNTGLTPKPSRGTSQTPAGRTDPPLEEQEDHQQGMDADQPNEEDIDRNIPESPKQEEKPKKTTTRKEKPISKAEKNKKAPQPAHNRQQGSTAPKNPSDRRQEPPEVSVDLDKAEECERQSQEICISSVAQERIRGIDVPLPFRPHQSQQEFMRSLMQAIQQSKNAALEWFSNLRAISILLPALSWLKNYNKITPKGYHKKIKIINLCPTEKWLERSQQKMKKFVSLKKIATDSREEFSPDYYAFPNKNDADLIFMRYECLLNENLAARYCQIIRDSIVIFDHASDLQDAACKGFSIEYTSDEFLALMRQINRLGSEEIRQLGEFAARMNNKFLIMAQQLVEDRWNGPKQREQVQTIKKKDNIIDFLYRLVVPAGPLDTIRYWYECDISETRREILAQLSKLIQNVSSFVQRLRDESKEICPRIEKFIGFLKKIVALLTSREFKGENWFENKVNHYRLFFKAKPRSAQLYQMEEGKNIAYEFNLACLSPSLAFQNISSFQPRCIILAAGILSPLEAWEKQLKIPIKIRLLSDQVIPEGHIRILGVSKTPANTIMNLSNQHINHPNTHRNLAQTILQIVKNIPSGVIVLFPSYEVITSFRNELERDRGLYQQFQLLKQLCFETEADGSVLEQFEREAVTQRGAILFCAFWGKSPERLSFKDQFCRGLMIVGIPSHSITDPILLQKRSYQDQLAHPDNKNRTPFESLSGRQWSELITLRAASIIIARVFERVKNYGLIFLLGTGYDERTVKEMLPKWIVEKQISFKSLQDLVKTTRYYFEDMKARFPA